MEEHTGLTFPEIVGIDYNKYGFSKIGDSFVFSVYKAVKDPYCRDIIKRSFEDFAKANYKAMVFDSEKPRARKRKLFTFIKSIYEQDNYLVSLVMIKAINHLLDNNYEEEDVIERIVREFLPNAGFKKTIKNGRYIWTVDNRKKFKQTIGKAFVLNYINSNFDKDSVWLWLKKHCYRTVEGTWVYKKPNIKEKFFNIVKSFIKDGGTLVEENLNQEFNAFMPLAVLNKDASGINRYVLEKEVDGKKTFYVQGVAANTEVDRDEERIGEVFIEKMKKEAKGLPLIVNTHYPKSLDETIGVIVKSEGDKKTFEISAKLESPEANDNVKKALSKMDLGVNFGFSVGGRITKAFREYNKKLDKEIIVLADGQLHHVLLTNQPANPTTFAEAVAKSLHKEGGEKDRINKIYSVKHSSICHKNEPSITEVIKSVSELPDTAFPINHKENIVCKDYAHHFMDDEELFLHQELLVKSYQKAITSDAPNFVINHLQNHLYTIGLNKMVKDIDNLKSSYENLEEIQNLTGEIASEMKGLLKSVSSIRKLKADSGDKMKMLKGVINDVSENLINVFDSIDVEEN